jgi:hypothetical protein
LARKIWQPWFIVKERLWAEKCEFRNKTIDRLIDLMNIHFGRKLSGTDVMILKIFSPKNLAKILAFFAQTTARFCKNCDHDIGF